jgi:UDP-N-acetylmuramoylalanine--D-glutamate ligase
MTTLAIERNTRAVVVGLGRSGCAAARFLLARGVRVTASDIKTLPELSREVAALADAGVELRLGTHEFGPIEAGELLVVSPGVPLGRNELVAARRRGARIISELDLAAGLTGTRTIGITGSNGKSTATALVAAMLAADNRAAIACGNFGVPLCDAVQPIDPVRWYAIELSSFQLELLEVLPLAAAVILNIQADHLDRHGDFEGYLHAKLSIARQLVSGGQLVLCVDDPELRRFAATRSADTLEISLEPNVARGGFRRDGRLWLRVADHDEQLAVIEELPIPGDHNQLNILAAAAAARACGVSLTAIQKGLAGFRALPHRLEQVAQVNGVRYIDDSKATNVGSALEAIKAYAGSGLWVLLGGRDKASDYRPLTPALAAAGATALTFGEAGGLIAEALESAGATRLIRCHTLEHAVLAAAQRARPGDVVLLSPACASFDAYANYAARGDHFTELARQLAERR